MKRSTFLRVSLGAFAFTACTMAIAADEYPNRPIELLVPFAVGGGTVRARAGWKVHLDEGDGEARKRVAQGDWGWCKAGRVYRDEVGAVVAGGLGEGTPGLLGVGMDAWLVQALCPGPP